MAITVDVTPNNTTVSPQESVTTTLDITTSIPTISAFRPLINGVDAGGDGSFAYDSSTGVFTYTGPSVSEVRAHFSAGTGVTYSSGQFSIGQDVATTANTNFSSVTVSSFLDVNGSADISGDLTGVDTLTATLVNATTLLGNTVAGSSLDINGNADISGDLTGVDTLTATTFSGSGASLTNIPAAQLAGTIDDARIPSGITRDSELTAHTSLTNNPHSVTAAQVGLSNVTNESKATMFSSPTFTGTVSGVTATHVGLGNVTNESKATMFTDPTFTGNPQSGDAPASGNHLTNKTYVDAQVAGIVDGAPGTLNTLNEIAIALNNDAALNTTLTNSIGEKLAIASNLSDLANASTARTNLGLGSAATTDATAYATAAQGTKADNALVASTVSTFGGTLIDDTDAATARTTLGLGTAATTASSDYAPAAGSSNILTTGALNSGSITSGFTSIDIGSGALTAGATTVNGNFIVNNDSMEVVSTDDGATAKPILSLYRNSPSPTNNDRMGGIRFFGNNNADPVEKTFYAGIDAVSSNVNNDGNVGSLRFYLADQSSTSSPISDVSANITDDEDPVMTLHKHGLVMGNNNDIFLDAVDDVLKWDSGNGQSLRGRATDNGSASIITLPDVTSGTLAVTDAETFTGGMTVEGGLTSSPPIQTITGATTSVNNSTFLGYAGKRIMVTTTNALTIDLPNSGASDEGKTWVIMNASSNEITLDTDNNGTAQYFRILTGGSVITPNQGTGGVEHIKITKGGIAELVCLGDGNGMTAPSYVIFGSGVHYE